MTDDNNNQSTSPSSNPPLLGENPSSLASPLSATPTPSPEPANQPQGLNSQPPVLPSSPPPPSPQPPTPESGSFPETSPPLTPLTPSTPLTPPVTPAQAASPPLLPPEPPSPIPLPSESNGSPGQPIPPPPPPQPAEENGKPSRIQGSIFKWIIPVLGAVIGIVLLFLLVTRVILPRFSGSSNEPEPVTLTYWGLWEETPLVKPIIDAYISQNPHVTINYQQQSHREYRERLQSALAQGQGPDIFRFHNTWVPMLKSELAAVPSSVFDTAAFSATFYPVAQKDLIVGNQIVGIPLMIDGLSLYYNKTIFTAAGKSPPTNWEELRQTAFDLVVRDSAGRIQTAGIALGTATNVEHWPDILALMILQNGGNPASPSTTATADALRFYTIFTLSDRVWDDTLPNSIFAFATEKVAMILAPSWQAHAVKEINPSIDFGVIPVPQLPGNTVTWASYWVEGVSAKSQNQEEAFKFLKYISDRNTLVNLYTEASQVRLFGEPYSRVDLASTLKADEFVGAYINQAKDAQSFYMASRTFDNGINDKIIKYYEDAVNAVGQGEDAETALQTVAQGVAQVLSQYNVTPQAQ